MISERLKRFLEAEEADYEIILHAKHPARSKAPEREILPQELARVFIVEAGGKPVMVVLPACHRLDPEKVGVLFDAPSVSVSEAKEFSRHFPDCEPDALPAIGRLYDLPCLVDETMFDRDHVFFAGGKAGESVKVSSDTYWRIAQAEVGDFRVHALQPSLHPRD